MPKLLFLLLEINFPDLFLLYKWRQRLYTCATYCTKYPFSISEYRKEMPTELGMCQCQCCQHQSIPMKFTTCDRKQYGKADLQWGEEAA